MRNLAPMMVFQLCAKKNPPPLFFFFSLSKFLKNFNLRKHSITRRPFFVGVFPYFLIAHDRYSVFNSSSRIKQRKLFPMEEQVNFSWNLRGLYCLAPPAHRIYPTHPLDLLPLGAAKLVGGTKTHLRLVTRQRLT